MSRFIKPLVDAGSRREQALDILAAALAAVDPGEAIRRVMRRRSPGSVRRRKSRITFRSALSLFADRLRALSKLA